MSICVLKNQIRRILLPGGRLVCWISELFCLDKESLTFLSGCHFHWEGVQHLPALLAPQSWQKAQDQGELPAHDDVCWYERARLSFPSLRCLYLWLKARFPVSNMDLNMDLKCCTSATAWFSTMAAEMEFLLQIISKCCLLNQQPCV